MGNGNSDGRARAGHGAPRGRCSGGAPGGDKGFKKREQKTGPEVRVSSQHVREPRRKIRYRDSGAALLRAPPNAAALISAPQNLPHPAPRLPNLCSQQAGTGTLAPLRCHITPPKASPGSFFRLPKPPPAPATPKAGPSHRFRAAGAAPQLSRGGNSPT